MLEVLKSQAPGYLLTVSAELCSQNSFSIIEVPPALLEHAV